MPVCPAGHDSATEDYCDVCGARLSAASAAVSGIDPPVQACPDCGAPRTGRFCEQCGRDFPTGASGTAGVSGAAAVSGATGTVAPPAAAPPVQWTAHVTADRAY
jgi:hypothetical protein